MNSCNFHNSIYEKNKKMHRCFSYEKENFGDKQKEQILMAIRETWKNIYVNLVKDLPSFPPKHKYKTPSESYHPIKLSVLRSERKIRNYIMSLYKYLAWEGKRCGYI